jgi:D-alanyl-D-alanine carboxypeptidase
VPAKGFDKNRYSTSEPLSPWVVVNKGRVLAADYIPVDLVVPNVPLSEASSSENMHLRSDAAPALEDLVAAAAKDSIKLMLVSGYRSYATQQAVYSGYVSSQGQAYADSTSARPGHSEHQTGLAADLGAAGAQCQLEKCFGDMVEGKWLAANAYKYGFIIRYQKDKTNLTGYDYEPWHIRFVGTDLAAELNKTGQTMEQFFGLPAYTDYPAQQYDLK